VIGLLICQPGDKLPELTRTPGDFADWVLGGMGVPASQAQVVRPHRGEPLPPARQLGALVVTGSAAMVNDPDPWIRLTGDWLGRVVASGIPVLGICFGHQLLAHALGGRVDYRGDGVEVGTVPLTLTGAAADDPLFTGLPRHLHVHVSHRQSVQRLPAGATLLGGSPQDPHHAWRIGANAWGVQFHPEFDAAIVAAHLDHYRSLLEQHGHDPEGLRQAIHDSPWGGRLLRRFATLAGLL
jgi:GMP synthase (glutamine-hydrolysing)